MACKSNTVSRRLFLKGTAAASIATMAGSSRIFAAGSDKIKIGLVGCGKRGYYAAVDCMKANQDVELVAAADLFQNKLDAGLDKLKKQMVTRGVPAEKFKVTPETSFVGFDAYKKVLACDIDLVLLVTPPQFRPLHLRAALEANKHVFMEKPVAVDPVGVRSVIESAKIAKQKNLAAMAGTQKRHQYNYLDIMKKIHDGDIGELVAGQCYFTTGELIARHRHVRQPDWSDMEWQCRNWYYFTWLSGDHLVEQAIHEIDAINWAFNDFPVKAMAIGGRQNRKGIEFGHIFDHFAVEYEYANGARTICMARQADGCSDRISDRLVGTKGTAYFDRGNGFIKGLNPYTYNGPSHNPQEQEHADLVASIRAGNPLNDAERIAKSTLTAIMGRMSAYTGRELSFKWALNASKLDLTPPKYDWIDLPMPEVAVPGKTKLI